MLILFILFTNFYVKAQTELVCVIYGKFNDSAFNKKIIKLYKAEYGRDIDLKDIVVQQFLSNMKKGAEVVREKMRIIDTLKISLQKDTISFRSAYSFEKIRTGNSYLSLKTNELIHIYRDILEENKKMDTSQLIKTEYEYFIKETNHDSLVLGFNCKKILIKELKVDNKQKEETRSFVIWATEEISPAIPVFGFLWLHNQILTNWTPLFVEEIVADPYPTTLYTKVIFVKTSNPK